jgi:hypothetical protein
MHPTVTVKRSNWPDREGIISWELECLQANEPVVNPYVLSLSGSVNASYERVSHLQILFGTQEIARIPVDHGDFWKKIQSMVADPSRKRFRLMARHFARRLFAENERAEPARVWQPKRYSKTGKCV